MHSLSGVAWCSVALALRFISILGVGPAAFSMCVQYLHVGFSRGIFPAVYPWRLLAVLAVSGSFAYYMYAFARPRGFAQLSVRCVGAQVLSSISPPSSPIQGSQGPSL